MIEFFNSGSGILGSLRRAADSVGFILKNRAELAAIELKEEKANLISAAIWSGVFIFSTMMAAIAISCTVLFAFWEQKRNVAIGFLAIYLVGAIVAFLLLKRRLKKPMPFVETIAQFKKDRAWLQS